MCEDSSSNHKSTLEPTLYMSKLKTLFSRPHRMDYYRWLNRMLVLRRRRTIPFVTATLLNRKMKCIMCLQLDDNNGVYIYFGRYVTISNIEKISLTSFYFLLYLLFVHSMDISLEDYLNAQWLSASLNFLLRKTERGQTCSVASVVIVELKWLGFTLYAVCQCMCFRKLLCLHFYWIRL